MSTAPRLERIAAEAEEIVLAMPPADQKAALAGVGHVLEGARQLTVLPSELVGKLWQVLVLIVMKTQVPGMRMTGVVILEQLANGAPTLIGPHKEKIAEGMR